MTHSCQCQYIYSFSHTQTWAVVGAFKITSMFFMLWKSLKFLSSNSSFTTVFSCGSAFRPPAHKAGTSSASWCGTCWLIPWGPVTFSVLLEETRKQNNWTQCAITTNWLTGLLRNKHRRSCDLYASFSPAPLSRQTLLDLMDFPCGQLFPWELV